MKKYNVDKRLADQNSVKDILQIIIKNNPLEQGIHNLDIKDAWRRLLGPGIANYTLDIKLNRKTLYVALSSPIVREELSYGKSKIIAMLNEDMGSEVIQELVFR